MSTAMHQPNPSGFDIHDRLRKARKWADLDQGILAEEIGVSRNTVGNYERGATRPKKVVVLQWAFRCGVSFDWLWEGTGEPHAEANGRSVQNWKILNDLDNEAAYEREVA